MRREIDEQEFLEFARSYCPKHFRTRSGLAVRWELIEMSERPNEEKHVSQRAPHILLAVL
jgi:hypothetical protein